MQSASYILKAAVSSFDDEESPVYMCTNDLRDLSHHISASPTECQFKHFSAVWITLTSKYLHVLLVFRKQFQPSIETPDSDV
jgi:hypothetical protein